MYLYLPAAPASPSHDCITITMVKSNDIRLMTSGADWYPALPLQEQPCYPIRRLGKKLRVPHCFGEGGWIRLVARRVLLPD